MRKNRGRGFGDSGLNRGFKVIKLHEDEVDKILRYDLGLEKVRRHTGRKGINWMLCCPFFMENADLVAE